VVVQHIQVKSVVNTSLLSSLHNAAEPKYALLGAAILQSLSRARQHAVAGGRPAAINAGQTFRRSWVAVYSCWPSRISIYQASAFATSQLCNSGGALARSSCKRTLPLLPPPVLLSFVCGLQALVLTHYPAFEQWL